MTEANKNALKPVVIWTLLIMIPTAIFAFLDYPILNWVLDNEWAQVTAIWVLFALFCGWLEANYYDAKIKSNIDLKINEHIIWNGLRFFVWIASVVSVGFLSAFCLAAMFPFIHDGKYYAVRNKLNPLVYSKGFFDNPSGTGNAILDLDFWIRTGLCAVGAALLIILNVVK